jgi:HAD superfamily hydrolase (TIGR01509 family)
MVQAGGEDALEAVVFDLDGVLLESEQIWAAAKRELTEQCGGSWKSAAEHQMLGMSSPEWSSYMQAELGLRMSQDQISSAVVELMMRRYREQLPLIAGADGGVRRLAACWALALASASNREIIDLVLELAGWGDLFAVTVSAEEVDHGKPEPDVYLEAVHRLGSPADLCVAVEDSSAGIRSASAAGLGVIAIPNRSYPPDSRSLALADVVLESISELDAERARRAAVLHLVK